MSDESDISSFEGCVGAVEPYLKCVVLTANEMKYNELSLSCPNGLPAFDALNAVCDAAQWLTLLFSLFFSFQFLSLSCVGSFNQRHLMSSGGLELFQRTVDAAKKNMDERNLGIFMNRASPLTLFFSSSSDMHCVVCQSKLNLRSQTCTHPQKYLWWKKTFAMFLNILNHTMTRFFGCLVLIQYFFYFGGLDLFVVSVCLVSWFVWECSSKLSCTEEALGIF
ncbi:unnamed protein product [Ixodes persulcatus]